MNEYFKIILTAALTLIGGVALLILNKIFVEQIQEVKKVIGLIAAHIFKSHSLLADVPNPDRAEVQSVTYRLQELSADLRAAINTIPWFSLFSFFRLIPPKENLLRAAGCLSKLSYSQYEDDKSKISGIIEEVYRLLNLKMYED